MSLNRNISSWKGFEVGKLFRLEPTKGIVTEELVEGKDVPYIAAKHTLNGLSMMCQRDSFEDRISDGNCIVFVQIGAGSAGFANYLEDDFIGMSGKTCCGYIDDIMNSEIGLFLETILCQERMKYSFGRSRTGDRLKKTVIKLPIKCDENGNPEIDLSKKYSEEGFIPDWNYMEHFIRSLHYKPITTKIKGGNYKLLTDEWKDFKISKLFTIERGNITSLNDIDEGDIPIVSASGENEGISFFSNIMPKFENKITVSMNGVNTGFACYHSYGFNINVDACVLNEKFPINKYIGLFLSTILNSLRYRYSYGRKMSADRLQQETFKLPIKKDSNGKPIIDEENKFSDEGFIPDWDFMENYIKNLPYGDRI